MRCCIQDSKTWVLYYTGICETYVLMVHFQKKKLISRRISLHKYAFEEKKVQYILVFLSVNANSFQFQVFKRNIYPYSIVQSRSDKESLKKLTSKFRLSHIYYQNEIRESNLKTNIFS